MDLLQTVFGLSIVGALFLFLAFLYQALTFDKDVYASEQLAKALAWVKAFPGVLPVADMDSDRDGIYFTITGYKVLGPGLNQKWALELVQERFFCPDHLDGRLIMEATKERFEVDVEETPQPCSRPRPMREFFG